MDATPSAKPPSAGWRVNLLIAGAAALAAAAGATFYLASKKASAPAPTDRVRITVTADSCEPNDITLPAGRTTFEIVNASNRAIEWEILDGVVVIEERENIAPGLSLLHTAKLNPGVFAITCGLLNNPRGKLTVLPSAQSQAESARPPAVAFIGPLAEYQVYLVMETEDLLQSAEKLAAAVRAGDLAGAQAAYPPAHAAYLHVAPAAQRFGDLDAALDARADFYKMGADDPSFSGLRRIRRGLENGSLDGLGPVADKLEADLATLKTRIRALKLAPQDLASGAARRLDRAADLASFDDAADLSANLAGVAKAYDVLRPLILKAAPDLAAQIDATLADSKTSIAALKNAGEASPERAATVADLRQLADQFNRINAALGLD